MLIITNNITKITKINISLFLPSELKKLRVIEIQKSCIHGIIFYINLPGAQHVDVKAVVFALRELSQPQHPLEQHLNLERIQRGLVRYPKKNSVIERGSIKCNIWKITIFAKYVLPILHKFLEYGTCL